MKKGVPAALTAAGQVNGRRPAGASPATIALLAFLLFFSSLIFLSTGTVAQVVRARA